MCGTLNGQDAQTCKSCGYIFEDFSSTEISDPLPPQWKQPSTVDRFPSPPDAISSPPTVSTGSPLFVASKSIVASLVPGIAYLVFVSFFASASGFSIFSLGVIAVFILLAVLPVLFTPRKYEFYDSSLRMSKTIGRGSEIPYSGLQIQDNSKGRRPRIILYPKGQRRSIVIPGNPTNQALGEDLNQFLLKKLEKYDPHPRQSSDAAEDTDQP